MPKNVIPLRKSLILLIVGVFIGILLLIWQANEIPIISYADGVSYLSAMGNQGLYENNTLTSNWVFASQWKELWNESVFFQFDRIRYDIAHYDIHPPLYFWILHVWCNIVGVELSTGPLLNIFFHVMTSILIFLICIRLRCSYLIAVAVGLLWLLNGSIMSAAQETRQYSLLALSSVLYLLSLLVFLRKKSNWALPFITIAACMGMLVHYHFALLLGVSVIYLSIFFIIKNKWVYVFKFFAALGFAALIFLIIHPEFYVSFERQLYQAQVFSVENIIPRTLNCKSTLIELFKPKFPIGWLQKLTLFAGITGSILLGINYILKQKNKISSLKDSFRIYEWLPLIAALFTSIIIFALYILQYTPKHAMNPKYIMLVSPIYFIVIGQFFNLAMPKNIVKYFFMLLLIFQTIDTSLNIRRYGKRSKYIERIIPETMKAGIPIILDSAGRGVLPPILWHIDNDTKVYATSQRNLITGLPEISTLPSILYVSNLEYHRNNIENQKLILEKFHEKGYELIGNVKSLFDSKIFLLKKDE